MYSFFKLNYLIEKSYKHKVENIWDRAIKDDDVEFLKYLSKKSFYDSDLTMKKAISYGSERIIYYFIYEHGIQDWDTYLKEACFWNQESTVEMLFKRHKYSDSVIKECFLSACSWGNPDIVRILIQRGANDWDRGMYFACSRNCKNIVEMMIKHVKEEDFNKYLGATDDKDIISLINEQKQKNRIKELKDGGFIKN